MERAVAVKKLTSLLGKKLGYRVDREAPDAEERAAIKQRFDEARVRHDELKQRRRDRFEAVLAADAEYQALHKACAAAHDEMQKAGSGLHSYKFTVGTSNGMFFHIRAQGDSWEEVIAKLTAAKV